MLQKIKGLFLENIGIRQTIFKNTFWLVLAEGITGILGLAVIIYAARILGATEYGKFTFAFSFVSFLVVFADLGIFSIATREFSRDREKEKEFPAILSLGILLDGFALILIVAGSFFITPDAVIQKIIWILSVFILISSFLQLFFSFLRSRQKMEYEAVARITQGLIMAASAFFVIFYIPLAVNLGFGYLFSNIISLVLFLLFFHFYFQPLKLKWDKNVFKLLKVSWPLTFGFMASWIYITITSIMLGYFNLLTENGWYNAASKIAYAAIIPATLIVNSFYPVLSDFFVNSREKLQKNWDHLMRAMIFLAFPIMVGGITLAPRIINSLYGSGFSPSVFTFKFLVIVIGIGFINYPYSTILIVSDQQKKNFISMAIGAVVNIILNFILIPFYGLLGAVISTLIAALTALFLTIIISKYFTPIFLFDKNLLKSGFAACFSGISMFFIVRQPIIYNLNIFLSCAIGGLFYFFIFYLLYKIVFFKNINFKIFSK